MCLNSTSMKSRVMESFRMRPAIKRTIITSKSTGRRYYLVRSTNRPGCRRYYVCSKPECDGRVAREADVFCPAHLESTSVDNGDIAEISTTPDNVDESVLTDDSEMIDEEEASMKDEQSTELEPNDDDQSHENENNDSIIDNEFNDIDTNDIDTNGDETLPLSSRKRTKANRQIDIDEATGTRSFRDSSGRRRFLCMNPSCTNMLRRQTDAFCRTHATNGTNVDIETKVPVNRKRYSAPPSSSHMTDRFRSPFSITTSTSTTKNETNGTHSEEYESPEKVETIRTIGTTRSFRDVSGRIRFLCSIPTCTSRVARQSEPLCRRHQREADAKEFENNMPTIAAINSINQDKDENSIQEMDVNHNNTTDFVYHPPPPPRASESSIKKKRKHESQTATIKPKKISSNPSANIVISTTTLLDDQWTDILTFLRQFPHVQLSTNLVVNDSTTHLLVDDTENLLHCTITKKIVQAAVRHHVFIISARWIGECLRANMFLDEHPYEIISDSHTTLRSSIQDFETHNQYLFKSVYGFAIECRQCQGSINRNELIELIELSGGKLYEDDDKIDMLIVLCDTNEKNLSKIKEKYLQTNISNIKYVTSDFLLKSIIKFEIQDIDKYSL